MGMAAYEAEEHRKEMEQRDIEAGHKPGCLISVSPGSGGGYCNCGKFERGVNEYDPESYRSQHYSQSEFHAEWDLFFWGVLTGMGAILLLLGILAWIGVF